MIGTQRRPSEKHGVSFDKWNPEWTEFQPHPLSVRIYGEPNPPAKLIESIEELGIISPIVVWNKYVISGNNRWAALKQLAKKDPDEKKFKFIPTTTFDGSALEAEQLVIESNRQRIKSDKQLKAEVRELLRIEKGLASEREKAGKKVDPSTKSGKGRATQKVADATNTPRNQVDAVHDLEKLADEGNQQAKTALEDETPLKELPKTATQIKDNQPKPTKCEFCKDVLPTRKAKKRHVAEVHPEVLAPKPTKCEFCEQILPSGKARRRHVAEVHQFSPSGASVSSTAENPSAGNGSIPIAPLQNFEDELADLFSPRPTDAPPQPPKKEKQEFETPPQHLQAARELREWIKSETPVSSKRMVIKPCSFGYGAGLGQNRVAKGEKIETSFDLELRNLTADDVRAVGRFLESRITPAESVGEEKAAQSEVA